jgi:hypothetical protein
MARITGPVAPPVSQEIAGVLALVPGVTARWQSGSGSEEIQSIWGAWYQMDAVGLMAGGGRRDGSA